jgi:hypothetical protein
VQDMIVVVPDAVPAGQDKYVNTTITTAKETELNNLTREWDPQAEILKVTVVARYTAQTGVALATVPETGIFRVEYSRDLSLPYTISDAVGFRNGKLREVQPNASEYIVQHYDLTNEGFNGLGVAYYDDDALNQTVAYLAKYPAQTKVVPADRKKPLPKPKAGKSKHNKISDKYPAFRSLNIQKESDTVMFPSAIGSWYDSDGYDSGASHSAFRWSDALGCFALWDHSRGKPAYIEYGFGGPNEYFSWVAALPAIGALQVLRSAKKRNHPMLSRDMVSTNAVHAYDANFNWGLLLQALTQVVKAAIAIHEIFQSDGRSQAPQF